MLNLLLFIVAIHSIATIPEQLFYGDDKRPDLGINLGSIDYGMSQWVFTNKFKHANLWAPVSTGNNWVNWSYAGTFNTVWSNDGYPLSFDPNIRRGYMSMLGTEANYPIGKYVVKFDGNGNITLHGDATNIIMINPNKFEFTIQKPTTKGIILIITKPNVTNIDLRESFEENRTETFGTKFIDSIKMFKALRFSSWMVNRKDGRSDGDNDWLNRRPVTFYTQHGKQMVNIEYVIELGNYLSKDIWLSIPSGSNSTYIQYLAEYVKNNFNQNNLIYVEQSSDKGYNNNNRVLQMMLIATWKSVFGDNNPRVKYVLSTWQSGYYDNTVNMYTESDLKQFHYYSISGQIGLNTPYRFDNFNVTQSENYTTDTIIEAIRQQIFNDETSIIYLTNLLKLKNNLTLIGYQVGFHVHAPGYSNRFYKRQYADLELRLEKLIIEALRLPIVQDLYLDYLERWHRSGGGMMFVSHIVDYVNICPGGGAPCGYRGLLENLSQDPPNVPKYNALIRWLNNEKGIIPFTSDDFPKKEVISCSSCKWGTCYNGDCVCYDGFSGPSCEIQEKKFLDCHSKNTEFGINVNSIPDWSTELTFTDLQKRARKWVVHKSVLKTGWADWDQNDVDLSYEGYPKYLKIGQKIGTFLTRDVQARYPHADYTCLYDGDGVLIFPFADVKILNRSAGRIDMNVNHKLEMNNGIYYEILRTNPLNPVRNIRIFESRFESVYQSFPFHPRFLEFMRKFKTIRFMPWSNVFEDQNVTWQSRTPDNYYTFTLKTGVSIEKQVLLCNTLGSNGWFNLPHKTNDEYIENWAVYVRDNLRPDVKIYLEIGNECWGTGGPHECGNYALKMGMAEGLKLKPNSLYYEQYNKDVVYRMCYHAKLGVKYLDIIKRVFGSSYSRDRIKLVLGSQAAWVGPTEIFFLCNGDFYKYYDLIAIAPYLSTSLKNSTTLVDIDEFFQTNYTNGINEAVRLTKSINSMIQKYSPNISLGMYEAGPALIDSSKSDVLELSYKIHRDARIAQVIKYYIGNLSLNQQFNLSSYMHFYTVGQYSRYGCYGLMEASDSRPGESPKYNGYLEFIDSQSVCDWSEKESVCKDNCNSKGTCSINVLTKKKDVCSCYLGAKGDSCEQINYIKVERCGYLCNFKGQCAYNHTEDYKLVHTCFCNKGYFGYACELFNCTNSCNYNGRCVDYNVCQCLRGFKGSLCEIDCGCNTNGVCSSTTNECICDQGYVFINGKCELDCTVLPTRSACLKCSSSCGFGNCIKGSCSCWAGYTLDSSKSCTVKTSSVNDGSKLGINMNGVVDWSPQWAFVDIVKQARNWIIQHVDKLNTLYLWSLDETFNLTSERYPAFIPNEHKLVTLMLRDVRQRWPDGIYHVFYDGEGFIDFGFDAKIIEYKDKNKMKIQVNLKLIRDNGVLLKINNTNPLNPIRNLRIIMDGFEDIYQEIPFHPLFLQRLAKFKTIRFMPWTEQDGIVNWSDRITPFTYTQGRGVAFEYQIQLCNLLKTNAWFMVPYAANDNFVLEMAKLVKSSLRKDVTIYIEYTNEAWNEFFSSGKYCIKMGLELGLSTDKLIARNLFYSKRSKEIIEIWRSVFDPEEYNRLVLVLGTFNLIPTVSERILSYNNIYLSHPNIMLAITGYISCGSLSPYVVAQSNMSYLFSFCEPDIPNVKKIIDSHYQVSKKYNVSFGMYESGSSLMEASAIYTGSETPGATDKYIEMNRHPLMYDVYKMFYNLYNQYNMTENCHYAYVEVPSKYGPWYLLEYQNQSIAEAPRYKAIMDLIDETRTV